MPRKTKTQDDSDSNDDSTSAAQPTQQQQQNQQPHVGRGRNLFLYVIIGLVVLVLVVVIYFAVTSLSSTSAPTSGQVLNNITNSSGLNTNQSMFVNDLKKSESVSNLKVIYYSANATERVTWPGNTTVAINSNQTIDSYTYDGYNRTDYVSIVSYTDTKTNVVLQENVSAVEFYSTNKTISCFNDTSYASGLQTNNTLQCYNGDEGLDYLEQSPFSAANDSGLAYLVFNNTVSYRGTKSYAGRSCDDFLISNASYSNLQSNYTVYDICLDSQYGIPLYLNQTNVTNGMPTSFYFVATAVSADVNASQVAIPTAYSSIVQSSFI